MNLSYFYIYDQELSSSKYTKALSKLESHLLELGIKGRTARMSPLKNLHDVVDEAVRQGAQTIVAVGNDATFSQLINASAHTNLVLGFIPTDNKSGMARILGIPPLEAAADVVSARIIKRLDVGKVNNNYFIDSVEIEDPEQATISWGNFRLGINPGNRATICNIGFSASYLNGKLFSPTDGQLDVVISPLKKRLLPTRLPAKRLKIKDKGEALSLLLDNNLVVKTPATVEVVPLKIKVIVGSDRLFE